MSDVKIEVEVLTNGFREAKREMKGLGDSVTDMAGSVKGLLALEVASFLTDAASAAVDFARAGDEARRVAAGFTGNLQALREASFNTVDDTSLQKLSQLAKEIESATGVTQDLDAILKIATDRFANGLGGSVGENATAILNGEAEAMRKLGIVVDMGSERLQGLDETRKKAMITQMAAAQAAGVEIDAIEQQNLAMTQAGTVLDNTISDLQVLAAEFLVNSGLVELFAETLDAAKPVLKVAEVIISAIARAMKLMAATAETVVDILWPFNDEAEKTMTIHNTLRDYIGDTAEALDAEAEAAHKAAGGLERLNLAGLDMTELDTEGIVTQLGEEFRASGRDMELFADRLVATGNASKALAASLEEQSQAQMRAAEIQSVLDAIAQEREVMQDLTFVSVENAEKLAALGITTENYADRVTDAAMEVSALNNVMGFLQRVIDGVTEANDRASTSTRRLNRDTKDLVKSLRDARASLGEMADRTAVDFGNRLDDETRNEQLNRQREASERMREVSSELMDALTTGLADVASQLGVGSWSGGVFSTLLLGEDPDRSLEQLYALSEALGGISAQWQQLSVSSTMGGQSLTSLVDTFNELVSAAPEIAEANAKIAKGGEQMVSGYGALASTGLSAIQTFTAGLIEDQKVQAGLMAAVETANALASYPDPVGMATHFAAAALFTAVASGAFDSAGGGGSARGAAQAGAAFGSPTMADAFEADGAGMKETKILQIQVDGRTLGEVSVDGANESNSTFRRPTRLNSSAVGSGSKQLF